MKRQQMPAGIQVRDRFVSPLIVPMEQIRRRSDPKGTPRLPLQEKYSLRRPALAVTDRAIDAGVSTSQPDAVFAFASLRVLESVVSVQGLKLEPPCSRVFGDIDEVSEATLRGEDSLGVLELEIIGKRANLLYKIVLCSQKRVDGSNLAYGRGDEHGSQCRKFVRGPVASARGKPARPHRPFRHLPESIPQCKRVIKDELIRNLKRVKMMADKDGASVSRAYFWCYICVSVTVVAI